MTRRSKVAPILAIFTGVVAAIAIVSVIMMLGLLPPADLAVIGRLFTVVE